MLVWSSSHNLSCSMSITSSKPSSQECDSVLPLSTYNIFSFPSGHPVAVYISFFVFLFSLSSVTCSRRQLLCKILHPVSLPLFYCMQDVTFLLTYTWCNTSSFFMLSVWLIISILVQYHIAKLSGYFWFTCWSVKFQLCFKCCITLVPSVNLCPFCWWKDSSCWMLLLLWWSCV